MRGNEMDLVKIIDLEFMFQLRKILITQAQVGKVINYEELCTLLNFDIENHHDDLVNALNAISLVEFENNRPLLSVVVIDETKTPGISFFETLLPKLGIKYSSTALIYEQQKGNVFDFWQNENLRNLNYKISATLNDFNMARDLYTIEENNVTQKDFFTSTDVEYLDKYKGEKYDKFNLEHITAREYIKNSYLGKLEYLSSQLLKQLEDFETDTITSWSEWAGVENQFRADDFRKIYKHGRHDLGIYFSFGISTTTNSFSCKLTIDFEADAQGKIGKREIFNLLHSENKKLANISFDEMNRYDWISLVADIVQYIITNMRVYDVLSIMAEDETVLYKDALLMINEELFKGVPLTVHDKPTSKSETYSGKNRIKEDKQFVEAGNKLVIDNEVEILHRMGLVDLAKKVRKIENDRSGDILSFNELGDEKYIKVITTAGPINTPFYMSEKERESLQNYHSNQCIYRIFNCNKENNRADYFIIENPELEFNFEPIHYKVTIE